MDGRISWEVQKLINDPIDIEKLREYHQKLTEEYDRIFEEDVNDYIQAYLSDSNHPMRIKVYDALFSGLKAVNMKGLNLSRVERTALSRLGFKEQSLFGGQYLIIPFPELEEPSKEEETVELEQEPTVDADNKGFRQRFLGRH
jgi:hypothetical protein